MVVKIFDGRRSTYRYREALRKSGFRYCSEPIPHWEGEIANERLFEFENWCFSRKLSLVTPATKRDVAYRKTFFKTHPGNFAKEKHICAYCGRVMKKEQVTVDHLISVKKVQSSRIYLSLMRKLGFESINDVRNLVPSCKRCNSRKGAKGGVWLLKGLLGRYAVFWYIMWTFLLICFLALLYIVCMIFAQALFV